MDGEKGNERNSAVSEIKEVIKTKIAETEAEINSLLIKREKLRIFQETDAEYEKLTSTGFIKSEDFDITSKDKVFGALQQKIDKTTEFLEDLKNYLEQLNEQY